MKVIYKKSIFEKVNEARREAAVLGKEIEKIILNKDEQTELRVFQYQNYIKADINYKTILGIPVEFE